MKNVRVRMTNRGTKFVDVLPSQVRPLASKGWTVVTGAEGETPGSLGEGGADVPSAPVLAVDADGQPPAGVVPVPDGTDASGGDVTPPRDLKSESGKARTSDGV